MHYSKLFESGVYLGKFGLLIGLLVLSYVNGHTQFISANPREFLSESLTLGGTTALAFTLVALLRYQPLFVMLNVGLISFLIFFIFNVLLEFSGLNQATTSDTGLSSKERSEESFLSNLFFLIPLGLLFLVMMFFAWKVWDKTGYSTGRLGGEAQLYLEAALVGFATSIPALMVLYDRGERNVETLLLSGVESFALFSVAHIVLQRGGFYSHIFTTTK